MFVLTKFVIFILRLSIVLVTKRSLSVRILSSFHNDYVCVISEILLFFALLLL